MGQKGFFDIAQRYAGLDAKNDPLARIDEVVPWEDFRPRLEAAWRKPTEERKSPAGRKPWDAVVMFKAIVLCELYNLSDDQVEYQLRDRLSFMRFLGLGLEDKVPDAKTVWLYREQLAQAGVIETLFEDFDGYLEQQGYLAMGGQIIDASIVPVPKQRNSGDDNARIKEGETPEGWENQPAKRSQKDTDARWTKKHGKSHYGYKNHVNVDRRHKLVRRYRVTDAAVHDSQIADDILDPDNTASGVWADSAYRSAEIEAKLEEKGLKSRIHRKGYRNKPLSEQEKRGNTTRSKVRARVEHVFGAQSNDMGGTLVRSIGMVRARARIGLKNLAYNMRRLVQLERLATAASYHFPTAKGTVSPMQPSDGMILVIGPRLEGHSVIFLAIQTHLSCRFLLAVDSLGLRRSGSSSQIINQAQDFPEQVPRHRHLSQLERNVAAMSDNLGPDLHQLVAQRRHRPVLHLLRQSQCPHEVAQIVGQGVKLEPTALLRNLRHDRRVQLMAFLPSLMCCSAVPR